MMWSSSLASFKENLNKIAQDVHDEYDDSSIYNSNDRNDSPVSNRRFSDRSFSYSNSNGFDSAHDCEIDQYKAQIKKLQDSEAEIKALSVNYAALLKEKEDCISRINEENSSLKQKFDIKGEGEELACWSCESFYVENGKMVSIHMN